MTALLQFLEAHSGTIALFGMLLFKTATNALPAKGDPFLFGQWFMEWMRELGQQAPSKPLQPAQATMLADAGVPLALASNPASKPTGDSHA